LLADDVILNYGRSSEKDDVILNYGRSSEKEYLGSTSVLLTIRSI